ncbi:group III truncated hemoglobin [Falsiruegeria mediterranea]|jgi:hemoglobin|uniref:Group 3 truncated hemoglobin ctb n=1 Tax=Falsiruegeria mediterranea M17 TaxID=1200281 RepID=A0A2R8CDR5_9RHOB|nr:group III truncated hemoglobin [Falsiruegeria mediterranea]SPJ30587.1 Group 3 truncated hemoglobin ctb [Falsiruegeria mediterranea M17]
MNIDRSPKADITRADIQALLVEFYTRVRANEAIGPIFHHHIGEDDAVWAIHLAKIEDFWANVMLRDRAYKGNPMQTHLAMPEITPSHFDIWLNLFKTTAHEVLSPDKADLFDLMARRIGQSLMMGMQRAHSNQVPNLG